MVTRVFLHLARAMGVVCVTWTLTMALFALLPGDAARTLAGPRASQTDVARLRAHLALDRPLTERLAARLRVTFHRADAIDSVHVNCTDIGAVHFDLGRSYVYGRPVTVLLAERLPASLALAALSAALTLALGIVLGFAARSGRAAILVSASRVLSATPAYAVGLALHELFARRLAWLPVESSLATLRAAVASSALPAATLAAAMLGPYVALARRRWAEIACEGFVVAAIARGASARGATWRHGLRAVSGAVVSLACVDAGALVGGAVLTERLFRWPGVGSLAIEALLGRDVPTLGGVVLVGATAVALTSTLGEIARAFADPRTAR